MIIVMKSELPISPDVLWNQLKSPAAFQLVASPLLGFKPLGRDRLPEQWSTRAYQLRMYLFKLVPLGTHTISFLAIDDRNKVLSTDESGTIIRTWRHTMSVQAASSGRTAVFQDELHFRNGLLTWPTYIGVYLFFVFRHARMRQLIRSGRLDGLSVH
ncbi:MULTISPECIES: hypothetical protein [unclassified Paenibacillus]|uniref:hypothetical protein n=1 Tax=unclassified Paenibacillus TaxID=185978 RepID=UPI000955EB5A|nr:MULTISPECIES: hypothetical protein [unclassified Paenibacillus]ASS65425.2 hypothetical protein CIC07_04270 [Paenibacillus sp. RUD330]SIQ36653.1 hypothetical protein SAMN05880555_1509 [Paenibacillus sp. RU4X]SIQ58727.1 hypothetical protein SAMN05880570_1507 [Paenibacillus sp. RU4T]